jgi:hypothetical protein
VFLPFVVLWIEAVPESAPAVLAEVLSRAVPRAQWASAIPKN